MTLEKESEGKSQYRTRDDIALEMLERLASGPKSRTDFFYEMRVTYAQIDERGEWLAQFGLITIADVFKITAKGRAYLKARVHAEEVRKGEDA